MSEVMTVREVAAMLRCSESLIRRSDVKKALGAFVVGKSSIRLFRHRVEEYINRQMVTTIDLPVDTSGSPAGSNGNLTSSHGLW